MLTSDKMIQQGNWFFRHRSYLPLIPLVGALAVMYTQAGLYFTESLWFDLLCFAVALCGEVIRFVTVGYAADGTSGRNINGQLAFEINTTGIYSLVRHPLYVGNFLMWLGIALYTRIWWLTLLICVVYFLYYERIIMAEESFLRGKFGDAYAQYARRVPAVLPNFKNYQPNRYKFRVNKAWKQEPSSIFGLIVVFLLFDVFQDLVSIHRLNLEIYWLVLGIGGLCGYLLFVYLKKKTRLLDYPPQKEKKTASRS